MSYRLQCYAEFSGRFNNDSVKGGDRGKPAQLTVTGDEYKFRDVVAANTNTLVYNDNLGGFVFLWIQTNRVVTIELTTSGTNTEALKVELPGGLAGTDGVLQFGVPFILGSDDTYDADAAAARIATIRIYNEDTTSGNDAIVKCHVIN